MAQEPQVRKQNEFLLYLREKNPQLSSATDDELSAYIRERKPELVQYLDDQPVLPVQQQKRPLYRRINEAVAQPGNLLNRGASQIGQGNYAAGIQNVMAGGLSAPFVVPQVGAELLGEVPGVGPFMKEGLRGLASIPPWLFNAGRSGVQEGLNLLGLTPDKEREMLGQTPQQYGETQEASQTLGDVGSYYGLPQIVGRGVAKATEPRVGTNQRFLKSANVALDRALPTTSKELTRPGDRQRLAPYLAREQRLNPVKKGNVAKGGSDPSVIRQLAEEKIPKIKRRIWEDQQEFITRNADVPLEGGVEGIAANIESLRNIYTKNIDLLADKSIVEQAARFRDMKEITVSQATEMLRSINAELQKFYKQSNESQAAAQNAAKPIAEMEKAARALRDGVAKTLTKQGEDAGFYRKLHDDYGAAIRMEAAAERSITRAETPLPPMFTERVSQMYPSRPGIIREVGEHTLGKFFTPDKLATRALNRYAKGVGIEGPLAPLPPIAPNAADFGGIPPAFRKQVIARMGGVNKKTRFGKLGEVSDSQLVILAKEYGLYENAPLSEAPVSRGGSMDVRGAANQEQIRRFKK